MKRRFSHILLFLALIGNISHSFHDHYGHEADETTMGASSCPICIVEDLNEITHERGSIKHKRLHSVIERVEPSIIYYLGNTLQYNTRAPPYC